MFIRICFCFLCMGLVGRAQQTINLCEATANTNLGCVGELDGQDQCPNRPSNPCCTQTVCEYNANAQSLMPWNPQTYTWQLRGHETQASSANLRVNRYKALQPGQQGRETQFARNGWQIKICEIRYLCECRQDEFGEVGCISSLCGDLTISNIVRGSTNCTGGGGGPGGGITE